jgi:DHA2 family multidrug resistance protein
MMALNQAAITSVPRALASDASGLFNAARNLGGSIGLAIISTFQERRVSFHIDAIGSATTANSPLAQDYLQALGGQTGDATQAAALLVQQVQQQALVMAYNDLFWIFGIIVVATLPLVFLLKPLPKGVPLAMH